MAAPLIQSCVILRVAESTILLPLLCRPKVPPRGQRACKLAADTNRFFPSVVVMTLWRAMCKIWLMVLMLMGPKKSSIADSTASDRLLGLKVCS